MVRIAQLSLFVFAAVSFGFSALGIPPSIDPIPAFGVCIHANAIYPGDLFRIRRAGFTWIRTDLLWNSIERIRGSYSFESFDKLAGALQAQGLRALVILDYGNQHYAKFGDSPPYLSHADLDEFRQGYAAFSAAAVGHYLGRGFIWEQWNEPNNKHSWSPAPNSDAYVAAMKEACIAIRAKYPNEIIIGPASAGVDLNFVEACLRAGMLEYWSGVSVHPYRRNEPATAAKDLVKLSALIARYAPRGRTVPIICGEWGYSTSWTGLDDVKQAECVSRMVQFGRQENIPLTIWYDWRDDGDDPANQEDRFGLVRRAPGGLFEPKPAYFSAWRVLNPPLGSPK